MSLTLTNLEVGDEYTIAGLDVGLQAIAVLLERDRTTVGELAMLLNLGRSRAHRILRTLEARGFVVPSASGSGFVVGPSLLRLGTPHGTSPRSKFEYRPLLERMRELTGEDVHTAVLTGDHLLVTDGRRSPRTPSVGLRVGMVAPAHAMAGGKLLLSYLDNGQVLGLLPDRLPRLGPCTIIDRAALLDELAATRERGYAVASQESERDVASVAVLLGGRSWRDRITLVISCPAYRGGWTRLHEIGSAALTCVRET